jgi:hypothetical protein
MRVPTFEPVEPREHRGRSGREASTQEAAPESSTGQVHASSQSADGAKIRGLVDRSPNEVHRVSINPDPTPGQILGNRRAEIVWRSPEHLGQLTLGEPLVER